MQFPNSSLQKFYLLHLLCTELEITANLGFLQITFIGYIEIVTARPKNPKKDRRAARQNQHGLKLRLIYNMFALGGILDCSAYGMPSPKITWLRFDPTVKHPPITELVSSSGSYHTSSETVWQILPHNNSLKFRPFSPSEYRPEVHKASYVCKANSESGAILSRTVNVKSGRK
jgi:hypothetical protein